MTMLTAKERKVALPLLKPWLEENPLTHVERELFALYRTYLQLRWKNFHKIHLNHYQKVSREDKNIIRVKNQTKSLSKTTDSWYS